jgi:hypothetical protein
MKQPYMVTPSNTDLAALYAALHQHYSKKRRIDEATQISCSSQIQQICTIHAMANHNIHPLILGLLRHVSCVFLQMVSVKYEATLYGDSKQY